MSKVSARDQSAPGTLQSFFSQILDSLNSFYVPPFKGALVIAWAALVLTPLKGHSIWEGSLDDPDNYLYLVQAMDLLNGQSWFDHIQHRMNPPEGTYIHYSNFLAALYAGLIYVLRPFFGSLHAAFATAAVVPPIFFLAFLLIIRRFAQIFVDKEWGDATAFIAILSPSIMTRFLIGHVDHHGVVAVLVLIAYGAMLYNFRVPSERLAAIGGVALGLSLVLALETVSLVILFSLCLGIWAVFKGGEAAHRGLIYSLSLFVSTALLLLGVRAPQHLFESDLLAYSIVYVILTANIALCFAGVALARHAPVGLRVLTAALLAAVTGAVFLHFFPALSGGPYAGVNQEVKNIIFSVASEAWPVFDFPSQKRQAVYAIWNALVLMANGVVFMRARSRESRWIWGINFAVLASSIALAAFYQVRFNIYAHTFAILPLVALAKILWDRGAASGSYRVFWAMVLSVPILLVSSYFMRVDTEVAERFKAFKPTKIGCSMQGLASVLNDAQRYGKTPGLIINSLNEGSELLLRTPHSVLSAPYHTNVSGNLDTQRFFTALTPEEAKEVAQRRNVAFVVMCRIPRQLKPYWKGQHLKPGGELFVDRLVSGEVPAWLKQVQSPAFGDFLLFEVALPERAF